MGTHAARGRRRRSEEHTSELQSRQYLVCRLLRTHVATLFPYTTLFRSVGPAVPAFADACAIHLRGEGDTVALAAATHVEADKQAAMLALASRPRPNPARGWGRTLREGVV